jgi:hypothetical protein
VLSAALPIVESRNVIEDMSFLILTGRVVPMVDEFTVERPEETLNTGVVTVAPSLRHVCGNAMSGEQQLVLVGAYWLPRPGGAGALPMGLGLPAPW